MDELAAIFEQRAKAAGGTILYPALIDNLDYQQTQLASRTLRYMRDNGQITKIVRRNPENGQMEHAITWVGV